MNKLLPLAAVALMMAACSEKPSYEIAGTVSDAALNGKYVYLYEFGAQEPVALDSALVENGAFTMKGVQDIPALRVLRAADTKLGRPAAGTNAPNTAVFVLENAKMQAVLNEEAPAVTGTPENDAFKALQDKVKTMAADLKKLTDEAEQEKASAAIAQVIYEYVKANTDKQLAAKVFSDARYDLEEAQQHEIIGLAGATFKAVPGIDARIKHLETLKKVAIGQKFTDFEMADTKGKMHKLSEYVGNGKVTLIDFWASWCPPCRAEMPFVVEAYKQFKGKGFEVVGISLDRTKEAWEKGIKDLGITWPQLSDIKYWQCEGAAIYGVNSIPHTVLVDKDGTIIAKNLRGDALIEKLKEVLK